MRCFYSFYVLVPSLITFLLIVIVPATGSENDDSINADTEYEPVSITQATDHDIKIWSELKGLDCQSDDYSDCKSQSMIILNLEFEGHGFYPKAFASVCSICTDLSCVTTTQTTVTTDEEDGVEIKQDHLHISPEGWRDCPPSMQAIAKEHLNLLTFLQREEWWGYTSVYGTELLIIRHGSITFNSRRFARHDGRLGENGIGKYNILDFSREDLEESVSYGKNWPFWKDVYHSVLHENSWFTTLFSSFGDKLEFYPIGMIPFGWEVSEIERSTTLPIPLRSEEILEQIVQEIEWRRIEREMDKEDNNIKHFNEHDEL